MPLPLAPLIPLAVRLGLVATTTFALTLPLDRSRAA